MIQLYEKKEQCCGCTACMNVCPKKAIVMTKDEEGFLYPKIDGAACVECGSCLRACAFQKEEDDRFQILEQEVYAVKHKQDEVRKSSASGGAFTAISDYILDRGGMIYGAVFNDCFEVVHSSAVNKEQRNRMRGSKYVQSRLGNIFADIRANLEHGRLILFTGTPCQCGGLKSCLGKEYPNLVLCDIVCHGVPSPLLWHDYKEHLEKKYGDRIRNITFRCKDTGWSNSSLKVEFNECIHKKNMQDDPYYILFFSHISMRPSCHECRYASYQRVGDLSLADYWGIEKVSKSFGDEKGVSLVLANSKKGIEILNSLQETVVFLRGDQKSCYQPIFTAPSKRSGRREEFWREYREGNPAAAIEKYGKLSLRQRIIKKGAVPILKKTGLYDIAQKIYFRH